MTLKEYLDMLTPSERRAYADRCGTKPDYVRQIAGKHRNPGPDLAQTLAEQSGGLVPLYQLRPDIWKPKGMSWESQ